MQTLQPGEEEQISKQLICGDTYFHRTSSEFKSSNQMSGKTFQEKVLDLKEQDNQVKMPQTQGDGGRGVMKNAPAD